MNILTRYTRDLGLSLLAAATFSLATPAVLAQGQSATPAVASASAVPANLIQAIKLPPLPVLGQKVIGVSQKVGLDAQTQMMMLLTLSQFGFPEFPGVSASDGVTVFVLGADAQAGADESAASGMKILIFAKISAESPLRQLIGQYNFPMIEKEGWTVITIDPTATASVTDFAGLAAIAADKTHFDIETRTYFGKGIREKVNALLEAKLSEEGTDEKLAAQVRGWVNLAFRLADNYDWAGYGISVSAETLSAGIVAAPKAGTPDAKWINAPIPAAKTAAGLYLPANVMAGYASQVDPAATSEYLQTLLPLLSEVPNEKVAELVRSLITTYDAYLANSSGSIAGISTAFNQENQQILSQAVEIGKHDQATVDAFYDELFNKLVPSFAALFAELVDEGDSDGINISEFFKTEFKTGVDKIGDNSVSVIVSSSPDPSDPEKNLVQNTYYTVVKGAVLTASTMDELKALVATYSAGKPVAGNLAEAYPLAPNVWLKGGMDPARFAKVIAGMLQADESVTPLLDKIQALSLAPFTLEVKAESGHFVYELGASLDTIVSLVRTVMAHQDETVTEEVEVIEVQAVPAN